MKSDRLIKHLAIPAAIALVIYAVAYTGIEHLRYRKGPWLVSFSRDADMPALRIDQAALGITNVVIGFLGEPAPTHTVAAWDFSRPREVPYDVPFGECVFMDTTFLPGTVVFEMFGHEIQLLPRALTIDKRETAWQSGMVLHLWSSPGARKGDTPGMPASRR